MRNLHAAGAIGLTCRWNFTRARAREPEEFEQIRMHIEAFDTIQAIDPEMRAIVERNWPHLVAKLPSEEAGE